MDYKGIWAVELTALGNWVDVGDQEEGGVKGLQNWIGGATIHND